MAFKRHHFQLDNPTNNFATLNPLLNTTTTTSGGNLKGSPGNTASKTLANFLLPNSGKWYWEVSYETFSAEGAVGIARTDCPLTSHPGMEATSYCLRIGNKTTNQVNTSYGSSYGIGDVVRVLWDGDSKSVSFGVNETMYEVAFSSLGGDYFPTFGDNSSGGSSDYIVNFGQNPDFSGQKTDSAGPYTDANGQGQFYYQPPAGALALCTNNLPLPAITPHYDEKPGDYFKAYAYSGLENVDREHNVGFEPDLIWIKNRTTAQEHNIIDSVRGIDSGPLFANDSGTGDPNVRIRTHSKGITTFDMYSYTNKNNNDFIAWCWKAGGSAGKYNVDGKAYASAAEAGLNTGSITINNASINTKAGFGIYQYTGSVSKPGKLAHGLNQAPKFMIVKNKNENNRPFIGLYTDSSQSYDMYMSGTKSNVEMFQAEVDNLTIGFNKNGYGDHGHVNSGEFILYAWHPVPGYSAIGTYTGNQNTNGPFVYTGFKPAFVMVKPVSSNHWSILDSSRDEHNPARLRLLPSNNNSESGVGPTDTFEFLSNGFRVVTSDNLENYSGTVIYMAFAEKPPTPQTTAKVIAEPSRRPNDMRSIYFDGSSNYLSRTPTSNGNPNVWTMSVWAKGSKEVPGMFFSAGGEPRFVFGPYSTNGCYVLRYPGYAINACTHLKSWDFLASFKHFLLQVDTTKSALTDALKIWNNGNLLTFETTSYSNITLPANTVGTPMFIGQDGAGGNRYDGYFANIHFIDGQALEPPAFTETVDGVLIPKQYEGTYGTNGFHLDFAEENMEYSGDTITRVLDESPNSNHWTAH